MTCAFVLAGLIGCGVVQGVAHPGAVVRDGAGAGVRRAGLPGADSHAGGKEDLPNAIALNSIQFNVARVIGPVLGGLALTKLGAAWCFGLNGVSFVAVIISLTMLKVAVHSGQDQDDLCCQHERGLRVHPRSRGRWRP